MEIDFLKDSGFWKRVKNDFVKSECCMYLCIASSDFENAWDNDDIRIQIKELAKECELFDVSDEDSLLIELPELPKIEFRNEFRNLKIQFLDYMILKTSN